MDRVRQQFLAGAGFAEQQHRAGGLRGASRLPLDFNRSRTAADEAGERVLVAPLAGEFAPGVVEIPLQQREFADQRLQRGFGMVEQHDADRADDRIAFLVAQRNAADDEGPGPVGEQVHQDRLPGL